MRTIVVDDEYWMLKRFEIECGGIPDVQLVGSFRSPLKALNFAHDNNIELAFLDVEMPEMSGLTLASKLREIHPGLIVIFISAYEKYMVDAFRDRIADYYIMKPYDNKDIVAAVDRARLLSGRMRKALFARTFGAFELLLGNSPIAFSDAKSKELMAFLINARGEKASFEAIFRALFPNEAFNEEAAIRCRRILRNLVSSLKAAANLESIIEQKAQSAYLHTNALDCDLYLFLDGDTKTMRSFDGNYMTGFAWAQPMRQALQRQSELANRYNDSLIRSSLCACVRCRDDAPLTITYMNDAFLAITGYSHSEVVDSFVSSLRAMIVRDDYNRITSHGAALPAKDILSESEFRLVNKNGNDIWVLGKCEPATGNSKSGENELECIFIDISGIKADQQALEHAAQRDALTGLFNRGAAVSRIERYLGECDPSAMGALILVDIDNFKAVNDTYGHPFADTVLTDIAAILSRAFRQNDIVARLGGDEMLVFLKDVGSAAKAKAKLAAATASLRARLRSKTKNQELSCSFGGALFPDDAGDYASLYKMADTALYAAKETKDCTVWLSDIRMYVLDKHAELAFSPAEPQPAAPFDADIPDFSSFSARLRETDDLLLGITAILADIQSAYDVSRVYIFEVTDDEKYAVNTFELCADGINPEIANLGQLPAEQLAPYYAELFDNDGLLYCYDIRRLDEPLYSILEPQGIKSVLQCALSSNGETFGMIGFDECRERRYWSGKQIKLLADFATALGGALSEYRSIHGASLKELQSTAAMVTEYLSKEQKK